MVYTFFSEEIISLEEIEDIFSKINNYNISRVVVFDTRHRSLIDSVKVQIKDKLISKDTLNFLDSIWSGNHWHFTNDLEDVAFTIKNGFYDLAIINNDFMNKKALLDIKKLMSLRDIIMIKWGMRPDKIQSLKRIIS